MFRSLLFLMTFLALLSGCAGSGDPAYRIAAPQVAGALSPVWLRVMESGANEDLDHARRVLAAFFDSLPFEQREPAALTVHDLPAPAGCAWVSLGDQKVSGFLTPLGRLGLCRIDDGVDLSLQDFEQVVWQQVDGQRALRLVIRAARARALEELTAGLRHAVLLFVADGRVSFAAAVDGPLHGDVMLVGVPAEAAVLSGWVRP